MVRTTARLPKELTDWLAARAKTNHRSANAEMIAVLSAQKTRDENVSGTPSQVGGVFTTTDFAAIEQRSADMLSGNISDQDWINAGCPEEK